MVKKEKKSKQTKQNGHTSKVNGGNPSDSIEYSINAILSGIEKEMSDITDSDYSSSKQDDSKVTTPSRGKAESTSKKQKRKNHRIDFLLRDMMPFDIMVIWYWYWFIITLGIACMEIKCKTILMPNGLMSNRVKS